jgi:hypothetical protein
MKQQMLQTYQELMESLAALPLAIFEAQGHLAEAKRALADTKSLINEHELAALANAEGSNETKRKADSALRLANNQVYQRLQAAQRREQALADDIAVLVERLTREYGAACYQSTLHAGLLNYLANGKAPVTDSLGDVVFQPKEHNNVYVTGADAAAFDRQQFGGGKTHLDSLGV